MATDPLREVELSFDEPIVAADNVVFTIVVLNPTESTIEVPLFGPENWALDVEIRREDGELVWRRLAGNFALPAATRALRPGESFELQAAWNLQRRNGEAVPPGTYTVNAFLAAGFANRRAASPTRSITVPPTTG